MITLLLLASLTPAVASMKTEGDSRDVLVLASGKRIEGRIVQMHDPESIYIRRPGEREPERVSKADVAGTEPLVRQRLSAWLDERRAGADVKERWALVQRALDAGLPAMARLQAYDVLCEDPDFAPAHEFVGNRERRNGWDWSLDTSGERAARGKKAKLVPAEEFHEDLRDWNDRLLLESENYHLETNSSLSSGVDILFDLERTYCGWLEYFGEELGAAELPWSPDYRMIVCVFRSDTEGYTQNFNSERQPYYSAATDQVIDGSPNVLLTYFEHSTDARPKELFELALQQLMFTTLGLGHKRAAPPSRELDRWAHWIELGLSWWAAEHIDGPPGHAAFAQPLPGVAHDVPRAMAELALQRPRSSPLSNPSKEMTNLVSMEWKEFYIEGEEGEVHRAKARTLLTYLLSENPPVLGRSEKPTGAQAAPGIFHYLRGVYLDPKAHSTSELDECLGGKIENFRTGWRRWLTRMAF
jgi:hypothetical protein